MFFVFLFFLSENVFLYLFDLIQNGGFVCLDPWEARELEKQLKQITKEKKEAVRAQDFGKVLSSSLSYCL